MIFVYYNPYQQYQPTQTQYQFQPSQLIPQYQQTQPTMQGAQGASAPLRQASSASLIFVPTTADIAGVSVQPGQRVYVMAQNDSVIAVRESNAVGATSTIYCRMQQFNPEEVNATQGREYVTRSEVEQLVKQLMASGQEEVPVDG